MRGADWAPRISPKPRGEQPGCPAAGETPGGVETAVAAVEGVQSVTVKMTFDPPWDQSRMSDEARVALDMWLETTELA